MWIKFVPHRWRAAVASRRHDFHARAVLTTPPIRAADDGVVIFSMMGTRVLLPYLVAVKSLWNEVRRGRIVILDDGTLTSEDRATLAVHCDQPEIIPIASVDTLSFPTGGCWERLLTIIDRSRKEYWIQLDSDTVTIGPVPEVTAAIAAQRSFILIAGADSEIGAPPVAAFAQQLYPGGPQDGHVQVRFESRLGQLGSASPWHYARGCAGFAGFAPGNADRSRAAAFTDIFCGLLGRDDLALWGTALCQFLGSPLG
jgi:hypothetical protein